MSPEPDVIVAIDKSDIVLTVEPLKTAAIQIQSTPDLLVVAAGNIGPPGPSGKWTALTQSEYDLLSPPDPDTLYVIIQ